MVLYLHWAISTPLGIYLVFSLTETIQLLLWVNHVYSQE